MFSYIISYKFDLIFHFIVLIRKIIHFLLGRLILIHYPFAVKCLEAKICLIPVFFQVSIEAVGTTSDAQHVKMSDYTLIYCTKLIHNAEAVKSQESV